MKKVILNLIIAAAVFSCTKKEETVIQNSETNDSVTVDSEDKPDTENLNGTKCWLYAQDKDTAKLQLDFQGNKFSGKLIQNYYQKDGSFGYYEGEMRGDTLVGNYKMMAEGTVSDLEKVYLMKDGKISEGIGPYRDAGSDYKMVFVSYDSIRFGEMKDFHATDCAEGFISRQYDEYWDQIK